MTLQIFNPTDPCDTVVLPSDDRQIGERLLSDCVAEIKQSCIGCHTNRTRTIVSPHVGGYGRRQSAVDPSQNQNQSERLPGRNRDSECHSRATSGNRAGRHDVAGQAIRCSDWTADRLCEVILKSFLRRKLPYDDSAIVKMLTLVVADSITHATLPILSILSNVERHVEQNGMSKSVRQQLQKLTKTYYPEAYSADERKIGCANQGPAGQSACRTGGQRWIGFQCSTPIGRTGTNRIASVRY